MFLISHEHKAIYIGIPKTGSTSISTCLVEKGFKNVSYELGERGGKNDNGTGFYKNGIYRRAERFVNRDKLDSYFKFTFFRNPYDRMVSAWRYTKNEVGFKEFIKRYENISVMVDWHAYPQLTHITNSNGSLVVDHVAKFDNLEEEFNSVCDRFDIKENLPHLLKRERKEYTEYYDDEIIKLFEERFHQDIEFYNSL